MNLAPGAVNFFSPASLPPVNEKEAHRYAGAQGGSAENASLLLGAVKALEKAVSPKVCYAVFPVRETSSGLDLGFAETASKDLKKALAGCGSVLLFCATVGVAVDREIAKAQSLSPAAALYRQALGAERAEALCDAFCRAVSKELEAEGKALSPRFSPGYGDLPLAFQKKVFAALNPEKRIGVHLNDSFIMSPSKSVTALAGIRKKGTQK